MKINPSNELIIAQAHMLGGVFYSKKNQRRFGVPRIEYRCVEYGALEDVTSHWWATKARAARAFVKFKLREANSTR